MSVDTDELRTFSVTLKLPQAVLSGFHEVQQERASRGLKGQSLREYFTMRLLDYEMQEHVKRSTRREQDETSR